MQVEQRDLYDRAPQLNWAAGNVCLLGDAAHPMMPNLGQACSFGDFLIVIRRFSRRHSAIFSSPFGDYCL